ELMISIAIVLVLIIGVNKVFQTTSDAVGAGAALSAISRDSQGAKQVMSDDFRSAVPDSPVFVIDSRQVYAFNNPDDAASATTPHDPTLGNSIPASIYNQYNHRIDRFGFFVRGLFHRQTANNNAFGSPTTSTEGFVWYGHVTTPNGNLANRFIGPDANYRTFQASNNWNGITEGSGIYQYASNWALGRQLMLMKDPTQIEFQSDSTGKNFETFVRHYPLSGFDTSPTGPPFFFTPADSGKHNPMWLSPLVGG